MRRTSRLATTLRALLARGAVVAACALAALVTDAAVAQSSAPADSALSEVEQDALIDFLSLLEPEQARRLRADKAEARARQLGHVWSAFGPVQQELLRRRIAHATTHFVEPGASPVLTHRGIAFFLLGPPSRIHDEPLHDWAGEVQAVLTTPAQVVAALQQQAGLPGQSVSAEEPAQAAYAGERPTQVWVHSVPDAPDEVRVLWFVDQAGDGKYHLRKIARLPATERVSAAPMRELPPDLFEQVGLGLKFDALPEVTEDVLPLAVQVATFKAAESKTFVRLVVPVSGLDIDLELGDDPAQYFSQARVWLRMEQGGEPLYQASRTVADGELLEQDDLRVAEFGVPVRPGAYTWTALVVDGRGRGGRAEGGVDVPSYSGALALSTPVLARLTKAAASLPVAVEPEDGGLAPFQVGSYVVVPRVGATFRRGDTVALVVQVYGADRAVVEFDLWREGSYQDSVEPLTIDRLPATEIQLIEIGDAYADGAYKLVVTARAPGAETGEVVAEAPFRVKG